MAFTANILSWRFCHLNIVGCFLKRRPTKGGSRAPQDPPSYAPVVRETIIFLYLSLNITDRFLCKLFHFFKKTCLMTLQTFI